MEDYIRVWTIGENFKIEHNILYLKIVALTID